MESSCYSYQILMKLYFSVQIFEKYSNIKFRANPSSGNRVIPCGQTDGRTDGRADRQPGMTKLIVAFRYFANATNKTLQIINILTRFYIVKDLLGT
jgi:hypothetical protein